MAILTGDIKLLKSVVMADVPEGGGGPTGLTIADGVSNAIFPDISELDRAVGRVSLRKAFVAVQTDDTDTYFGGNVIVASPPADPRVSVTLFSTRRTFDYRTQAASRIESYLNKGPEWPGFLYENHIEGQRVVQFFQRLNADVVPVGRTLTLVLNEGLSTEKEQYVRVTAVAVQERTFTFGDPPVDYQANIVTCDISDALRFDFTGSPAARTFTRKTGSTITRDTVVADAGTYVGVVPLAQTASLGDFSVKGTSIFSQLVPSAQTETPISFAPPYNASGLPVRGVAPVTYTLNLSWTPTNSISLPGGCLPGSLRIVTNGITVTDSAGVLTTGTGNIGFIDYANGLLTLSDTSLSSAKVITYIPAARILRAPQSSEFQINQSTRSQSYVGVITPTPQPGTLSISYLAQGRWYVLSEQGNGVIRGLDSSFGVGTFNPETGAFVVTLGALPDAPSSLILVWGVPTQETIEPQVTLKAEQTFALPLPANTGVQSGSLTVTWPNPGNAPLVATAQTNGTLSGAGTGRLRAAEGVLTFAPNVLPAVGTLLTINYFSGPKQSDTFPYPSRNAQGRVPVTATLGAINPGSLEVVWNTFTDVAVLGTYTVAQLQEMGIMGVDPLQTATDDGAGNVLRFGEIIGTVNYTTGVVTFQPDVVLQIPRPRYVVGVPVGNTRFRINYAGIEYVNAPSLYPNDTAGLVVLKYNSAGSTNAQQATAVFEPSLKLVPGRLAAIIPGSVVLSIGSQGLAGDSGLGILRDSTVSGYVQQGLINYLTGDVRLTSWLAGSANAIVRLSCATTVGESISSSFSFRTASAPLRPGSLTVTFARRTGGTQNVSADIDGNISGPGVQGKVDYENGVVRVSFGTTVPAAGNETQPWYDAANVESGNIFRPAPIAASTLRYSAVAFSYLPLDADLLGIDPVRLPSDGRVPIFRAGGLAVVGHTGEITGTVANGQTLDCARVRLSRVRVIGFNKAVINTGFTADLELGTVTFTNVAGYSQPVTVQHRIEDMSVVREASISGDVVFTRPLTHNYPLGSFVSSALIAGDLFARTSVVFDQATWTGVFDDAPIGNSATATYNIAQYPIVVTNRGAIAERWALRFTNTNAFDVIGENVGVIATGNTVTALAPINPATGAPYFTLAPLGWGAGWVAGNVLRINTVGAQFPVWVVRTTQQGPETVTDDKFTLLIRGDVDTL